MAVKKNIKELKSNNSFKSDMNEAKKIEKERVQADVVNQDDEPSWYHYIIVFMIFASIFGVFYLGYYFFYEDQSNIGNLTGMNNTSLDNNSPVVLTKYPFVQGNITYNLFFHNTIDEIEAMNFPVQVDKLDLLNTRSFIMAFDNYNGTDNGEVARGSTKLVSFFSLVYTFEFNNESFVRTDVIDCSNSTLSEKVITFNPYSERVGVFYNQTNGCISFETDNPKDVVDLVDKLIYGVVKDE